MRSMLCKKKKKACPRHHSRPLLKYINVVGNTSRRPGAESAGLILLILEQMQDTLVYKQENDAFNTRKYLETSARGCE